MLQQAKTDNLVLKQWKAGEKVTIQSIQTFGIANCFKSLPIDSSIFLRIKGKSYKPDCNISLKELRYLKVLHYNIKGEVCLGELICNKDISNELLAIFQELFRVKYPIERMVLIDEYNAEDEKSMQANNTSCFNFRRVAGTQSLSNHSTGHAIDINPLYNPYIKIRKGKITMQPKNATSYMDRSKIFPYKISKGDYCYKLFKKHGFQWGGDWKSIKDFQHFEKTKK